MKTDYQCLIEGHANTGRVGDSFSDYHHTPGTAALALVQRAYRAPPALADHVDVTVTRAGETRRVRIEITTLTCFKISDRQPDQQPGAGE